MRLQHNIAALNTRRNLEFNNTKASKALEKLSSGYKINRAGDDAAGLAISEKMRGQIRGLDMAKKNAQDGISLIQTAEGAMSEVHALLQRGRELAVQAANDTNVKEDREALQLEIDAINEEITRIGTDTEFNTQKILNGTGYTGGADLDKEALITKLKDSWLEQAEKIVFDTLGDPGTTGQEVDVKFQGDGPGGAMAKAGGYSAPGKLQLLLDPADFATSSEDYQKTTIVHEMVHMQMASTGALQNLSSNGQSHWFAEGIAEFVPGEQTFEDLKRIVGTNVASGTANLVSTNITGGNNLSNSYYTASYAATIYLNDKLTGTMADFINSLEANGATFESALIANTSYTSEAQFMSDYQANGASFLADLINGVSSADYAGYTGDLVAKLDDALEIDEANNALYTYNFNSGGGMIIHIGANEDQNIKIDLPFISAAGLGTSEVDITDGNDDAITMFDNAIKNVSLQRAQMGAYQNRLEHTINNLGSTSENLTASESRIRDTDMAKEMMNFTKNNILMQAAQSMLAQANQQPQGVLQLLN